MSIVLTSDKFKGNLLELLGKTERQVLSEHRPDDGEVFNAGVF